MHLLHFPCLIDTIGRNQSITQPGPIFPYSAVRARKNYQCRKRRDWSRILLDLGKEARKLNKIFSSSEINTVCVLSVSMLSGTQSCMSREPECRWSCRKFVRKFWEVAHNNQFSDEMRLVRINWLRQQKGPKVIVIRYQVAEVHEAFTAEKTQLFPWRIYQKRSNFLIMEHTERVGEEGVEGGRISTNQVGKYNYQETRGNDGKF